MSRNIFELHRPVVEDSASQSPQLTMPRGFSTRWSPRCQLSGLVTFDQAYPPSRAVDDRRARAQPIWRRDAPVAGRPVLACAAAELVLTERHRSLYARQTPAAVAHVPVRRGLANARAASGLARDRFYSSTSLVLSHGTPRSSLSCADRPNDDLRAADQNVTAVLMLQRRVHPTLSRAGTQ
jgi:hypothetical protein